MTTRERKVVDGDLVLTKDQPEDTEKVQKGNGDRMTNTKCKNCKKDMNRQSIEFSFGLHRAITITVGITFSLALVLTSILTLIPTTTLTLGDAFFVALLLIFTTASALVLLFVMLIKKEVII